MDFRETMVLVNEQIELIEENSEIMYSDEPDLDAVVDNLISITHLNTLIYKDIESIREEMSDD